MWAMIAAFTTSSIFSIIFKDPAVGGPHIFLAGKLMALFLYIAPVMAALLIADMIRSLNDVLTICVLLIISGLLTFLGDLPIVGRLVIIIREHIGWTWMTVTIPFSFSLAYLIFHPKLTKKLQNSLISLVLGLQVFSAYFLGTATYKAIIIANYAIILTVFYYRSRMMAFLVSLVSIFVFLLTLATFTHYVKQETDEGSWGATSTSRIAIWQQSLIIFKERPIFGIGPYNYTDYSRYVASRNLGRGASWGVMTSAHGQYLQILVETGVIGTLTFLWFMIELLKLLKYFLKLNTDYRINAVASAIVAILVSRLAVALVGDYLIANYHNAGLQSFCVTVYFWVCLGTLIGLRKVIMVEEEQKGANGGLLSGVPTRA
jgi:hypothetical protein